MNAATEDAVLQRQVARGVGIYLAAAAHEGAYLITRAIDGGGKGAVLDGRSLGSTHQSASVHASVVDGARDGEVLDGRSLHVAEETCRSSAGNVEINVDGMALTVERAAEGFVLAGNRRDGCRARRYLRSGGDVGCQRHRLAGKVLAATGLDLILDPELVKKAQAELKERLQGETYVAIPKGVKPRGLSGAKN